MALPGTDFMSLLLWVTCLFLGVPFVAGQLQVRSCPGYITATRSSKVYWTPPTVANTNGGFSLVVDDQQPGRYYYKNTSSGYAAKNTQYTAVCLFEIIVEDNGSPVITSCPSDMTKTIPASQTDAVATWTTPTVENTANVRVTPDKTSGSRFGLGRNTVTYTFTFTNDDNAMSSYCSFDIFVQQGESTSTPSISCPDPITKSLVVGQDSIAVTWDDPTYQDNLGSVTILCARNKNDHFFAGRNDISCVGYFESGQTSVCDFYVNILAPMDSQNPSIVDCPNDMTKYVERTAMGAEVTWAEPTINDDTQQNLLLISSHTNGIFYNVGVYPITYTGTDNAGNSVMCSFRLTVENDITPPVIEDCNNLSRQFYVKAGETSRNVSWDTPTVADNSKLDVPLVGPIGNLVINIGDGPISLNYTATDSFGNEQICVFTVTLTVDQAPMYTGCQMNPRTVPTNPGVNYTLVTWPEPRVTDDRSESSLVLTKSYEPGMNYEIGVYMVEYTATDVIGNVEVCSFVITVADQEKPTIMDCPGSQTLVLEQGEVNKDIAWASPTATDNSCVAAGNCGTALTITSTPNPGLFTEGNYTVTVTAEDASRNKATCDFVILVLPYTPDSEMPVWTVCPSSATFNTDLGQPTYTYTWTAPVVTDDRGVDFEFASHTSPFAFPISTTTVTYRARDAANNEGLCTFDVTVTDIEPPVFTSGCGRMIQHYVLQSRTANLLLNIPTPTVTDNSGITSGITNSLSVTNTNTYSFPIGNTVITFTAIDTSGNRRASCNVDVDITRVTNVWSIQGTISMARIRGLAGTSNPQLLSELASDIDQLFRGSTIGSDFVGIDNLSGSIVGSNTRVQFRLFFTKFRQGRHTRREIRRAFFAAMPSTLTFATNNVVVANSLFFNVREFKVTSTITRLDASVNPTFVTAYDNPESPIYINLERQINTEFDATYTNSLGYQVSTVVDFRDGSIINDVVLVYDLSSGTTESTIQNQFTSQLNAATGQFRTSTLYFDRDQVLVQEICPDGECQNGGTCRYDAAYTNVCTCPTGFSGTNCEIPDATTVISAAAIAGIIGGGILLLLLLFAICCCCMYFLRQPNDPYKKDLYLERRPFNIIDEEASQSSMDVFMMPREVYYPPPVLAPPPMLALPPPPPPPPVLALPPAPPPEAPTLRLNEGYYMEDELFPLDPLYAGSPAPTFSPDGEVYVTGPNQVAIRPSTKRGYYGY